MKRLKTIVLAIAIAIVTNIAVAQSTKVHVVERGETIESIAKKYNVTKEEIVKLNPDVAQFVYVGMELSIPVSPVSETTVAPESATSVTETNLPQNSFMSMESEPASMSVSPNYGNEIIEFEIFGGLSINGFIGKDAKECNTKMGFNIGATARYYFLDNFFAEASLSVATKGYQYDYYDTSGDEWVEGGYNYDQETTTKYTSYNIDIPILVGYKFYVNEDLNFKIKAGPYFTYALSGKKTEKGYMEYYEDIHSSSTEHINKETKIGDIDGFKNLVFGIQAGVGTDYKRYILQAYYQRGLTKNVGKTKMYEQNILVSIGYRF